MKDEPKHQFVRHPTMIEHTIAAVVLLIILEQHSSLPEVQLFVAFPCCLICLVLTVLYCYRMVQLFTKPQTGSAVSRWSMLNWLFLPLVMAVMISSSRTHWPATIRFYFCSSSFEALIEQAYTGQKLDGFPRRVGLYYIERVKDEDFDYDSQQGTIGFVTGVALINECELLYDETDRTSTGGLTTRIAARWYITDW